ncbi:hypothetical protein ACLOJK_031968 [Asimina triloba]
MRTSGRERGEDLTNGSVCPDKTSSRYDPMLTKMCMRGCMKRCSTDDEDVFARLGEELWGSILSLLPLHEAVRTSVLSKSWRHAWKTMPELELSMFQTTLWRLTDEESETCGWLSEEAIDAWVKTVDDILFSHIGPIQSCCIPIHYVFHTSDVDRWIQVVTTQKSIQTLEIESGEDFLYEVPAETLFACETLKAVRLQYCDVPRLPPEFTLRCKNLSSLELNETAVDVQTLGRLLSQSARVESLTLFGCDFREGEACSSSTDLLHINAPHLKHMDIRFSGSHVSTCARIDAPRLKTLNLSCWVHIQKLEVFAPELEAIYCSTPKHRPEEGQSKLRNLLSGIKHAKVVRRPAPPNSRSFF